MQSKRLKRDPPFVFLAPAITTFAAPRRVFVTGAAALAQVWDVLSGCLERVLRGPPARLLFHAVTRIHARRRPKGLHLIPGRINLTFREI